MFKKRVCKIYLFRHGLTHYNKHHWFTGQIDSRMTKEGLKNARKIARKLKHKKIQVGYHTSLTRSEYTLREVLKYHPECKEVIEDDRMIERSYGKLERRSHKEFMEEIEGNVTAMIQKKYGKMKKNLRKEFGEKVADEIYDIYHRSYDIPPPGGESIKDVKERVDIFLADLLKKIKKENINVAISAHSNSMRPFRAYFEKLSKKEMMKLKNPWDDYFEYHINLKGSKKKKSKK